MKPRGIHFAERTLEDYTDPVAARANVESAIPKYGHGIDAFVGLYSYDGPAMALVLHAHWIYAPVI